MHVGLVFDGTDHFLRPIETALRESYTVERFSPRFVQLPFIGKSVNDRRLVNQLRKFTKHHDVVFLEWASGLTALTSRIPAKGKNVLRIHRAELFREHLDSFNWNTIDKIILVSYAMRACFLHRFPDLSAKAVVIPNGVNLQQFAMRESQFSWRIGVLGNLIPRKRAYEVICALKDLDSTIPWSLEIGGPSANTDLDYWDALKSLVANLGIQEQVCFCGFVKDPATWLQAIDIFVSASYSEGHQVALLEAMASGCYCLSHCWDGAEEVLPLEQIFTTNSDLRKKLLAYAASSEAEKQQSQAQMRALAEEKFDERRMIKQIIQVIEEVARQ